MTTANAGSKGASTASPPANTTATASSTPVASGATTTASSPAATKPQIATKRDIAAEIEEMRTTDAGDGEGDATDAEQQAKGAEKKSDAGDADPQGEKSKDDKGKVEEKMVPERALKERVNRVNRKLDEAKGQLASRTLELTNAKEALGIAVAEAERLRGLLQKGAKYDEQGEKIAGMELANKARDVAERTKLEHAQELEKAKAEAEISVVTDQLEEEVAGALASHDLVDRAELIREMKKDLSKSATDVAASLEKQKLERARGKLVKEKPSTPSTVRAQRAGGTNTAVKYSNDRKGIAEHIDALRSQNG